MLHFSPLFLRKLAMLYVNEATALPKKYPDRFVCLCARMHGIRKTCLEALTDTTLGRYPY